jgi:hypothetical protein
MQRNGYGIDGFDLEELPWTGDCRAEQEFFIELLARAARPAFHATAVTGSEIGDWTVEPKPYRLEVCVRHEVFHGEHQCRLCDIGIQPIDAPTLWELVSIRTSGGDVVDREIHQLPDEVAISILDVVDSSDSVLASFEIGPLDRERVARIVGRPLGPDAHHCLCKSIT